MAKKQPKPCRCAVCGHHPRSLGAWQQAAGWVVCDCGLEVVDVRRWNGLHALIRAARKHAAQWDAMYPADAALHTAIYRFDKVTGRKK